MKLATTQPSVVDELLREIQKVILTARVRSSEKSHERFGLRIVTFDRLDGSDYEAVFWIFARLCELGWEPMGYGHTPIVDFSSGHQLKKRCDSEVTNAVS